MNTTTYAEWIEKYTVLFDQASKKSFQTGTIRLVIALLTGFAFYAYFAYDLFNLLTFCLAGVACFFFFLKKHSEIKKQVQLYQELISINKKEQQAVEGNLSAFPTGLEYVETDHPYTYDLDIFGEQSLFQSVNRTCTIIGRHALAYLFKHQQTHHILSNQEAVKELAEKISWRQHFTAKGNLTPDHKDSIVKVQQWTNGYSYFKNNKVYLTLAYVFPILLVACGGLYLASDQDIYYQSFSAIFLLNLLLFGFLLKHIKKEYEQLADSSKRLFLYSQLIGDLEKEAFTSATLLRFKEILKTENKTASAALEELSEILFRIESMNYGLPAILSNGLFLYNIHSIYALERWKQRYGKDLVGWLEVISETDALNSLANFAFNHPSFVYPTPSSEDEWITKDLGHPLIPAQQRISNSIDFSHHKFVILTGSNMSGKSTFLRTLGLNLILAKMGSPVCATDFKFYPYEVFLSMRINDSLANNESFFFAELKRLKQLIDRLSQKHKTFILLDEILRGTNSNDKYAGTIGLVEKLVAQHAVGIIATHDLSVTKLTDKHPDYLTNKCFEVEIRNEELYFDYKLKEGVCEKMSASFLMKKMEII